jgi:hypothetical protein
MTATKDRPMDAIVREFAQAGDVLPRDAMHRAIADWETAAPALLAVLDAYAEGRDRSEAARDATFFILHLAAQARERRAFPAVCRLARDGEAMEEALGDGITETLTAILIGTFDGSLERLQSVIDDEAADEMVRSAALDALTWLTATGAVPREATAAYLRALHAGMRPQAASFVWFGWQQAVALLGLEDLEPLVADAFERELIDPTIMDLEDFEEDLRAACAAEAHADPAGFLAGRNIAPLEDAVAELSRWHAFSEAYRREKAEAAARADPVPEAAWPQPAVNPFRGVGRNDPCPCGSGRKFKKCCIPG